VLLALELHTESPRRHLSYSPATAELLSSVKSPSSFCPEEREKERERLSRGSCHDKEVAGSSQAGLKQALLEEPAITEMK
jgi:hypothetical protein